MSNRFAAWADGDENVEETFFPQARSQGTAPVAPVQIIAPPSVPQQLIFTGQARPASAPVLVQIPAYSTNVHPVQSLAPVPETCSVVKSDPNVGDVWAQKVSQLPDLVQAGVVANYNPDGVDAVRDFAGRPEHAEMAKWRESTRYYNGVTDRTAKGFLNESMCRRYGESIEGVRQSSSTPRGTGWQGL